MRFFNKYSIVMCFVLMPLTCLSETFSENTFTKSKLNISYTDKDSITKDSSTYGLTWNTEVDHKPFELLNSKYKISVDVSAESSVSESSTEKTEIDKHGVGLRLGAKETPYRLKPFIFGGYENIKESKSSSAEVIEVEYSATFKWGMGFTFPLIDQVSSGLKHDPILGLLVAHYRNYDDFPFDNKVYDETKMSIVFNLFALLNK